MTMGGGMNLAELEGLIRKGGVAIAPADRGGTEELTLPAGDGSGDERFTVTMQDRRQVQGMITLYNTRSGEPMSRDLNAIKTELSKTHRDPQFPEWIGKPMFTLDGRAVPKLEIGHLLCPLNPKSDQWAYYQALGARPCQKATLPHELAVQSHVRVKHKQIWENAERKRRQDIEEEERAWRRWQMAQSPMPASPAPPAPRSVAEDADMVAPRPVAEVAKACSVCGEVVSGRGSFGMQASMRKHMVEAHPGQSVIPTS